MNPRKLVILRETVFRDGDHDAKIPVNRVVAVVVIPNPAVRSTGETVIEELIALGPLIAETYLAQAVALLPSKPVSYGKAALVGSLGEVEHGAAILHPRLGGAMRAAVGGGTAIIPSTCKVAAMGSSIDVPLSNKDDVWSFDELDTITVRIDDAPKENEIVVILAVSDGGRPAPRIPKTRQANSIRSSE